MDESGAMGHNYRTPMKRSIEVLPTTGSVTFGTVSPTLMRETPDGNYCIVADKWLRWEYVRYTAIISPEDAEAVRAASRSGIGSCLAHVVAGLDVNWAPVHLVTGELGQMATAMIEA